MCPSGRGSRCPLACDSQVSHFESIGYQRPWVVSAKTCSRYSPRPICGIHEHKDANDHLDRVRWGQTEQGSLVVTLLSPVSLTSTAVPNLLGYGESHDPFDCRVTKPQVEALGGAPNDRRRATSVREALESRAFQASTI